MTLIDSTTHRPSTAKTYFLPCARLSKTTFPLLYTFAFDALKIFATPLTTATAMSIIIHSVVATILAVQTSSRTLTLSSAVVVVLLLG
ncbi:MAG: hypothetical protein AAGJ35_13460, partial [Myxococcota bacterium]